MRKQVTRVMLFSKQSNSYTFGHETGYKWVAKPLITIDHSVDLPICPTEWPKNCQISPNLWLFFGGGNPEESEQPDQHGTNLVIQLDTSTHRLKKLTEMPALMCAHQVIFLPASPDYPCGTVYIFGGLETMSTY